MPVAFVLVNKNVERHCQRQQDAAKPNLLFPDGRSNHDCQRRPTAPPPPPTRGQSRAKREISDLHEDRDRCQQFNQWLRTSSQLRGDLFPPSHKRKRKEIELQRVSWSLKSDIDEPQRYRRNKQRNEPGQSSRRMLSINPR